MLVNVGGKNGGKNGDSINDGGKNGDSINDGGKNGDSINDGGKNGAAINEGGKNGGATNDGGKNGGTTAAASYMSPKRIHPSVEIFNNDALPYLSSIYICEFLLFIVTPELGVNVVLPEPISIKLN